MYGGLKEKNLPKKHGKKMYEPNQDKQKMNKSVPDHAQGAPYPEHVGKPQLRYDKGQAGMHVENSMQDPEDELQINRKFGSYKPSHAQDKYDADDQTDADEKYKK